MTWTQPIRHDRTKKQVPVDPNRQGGGDLHLGAASLAQHLLPDMGLVSCAICTQGSGEEHGCLVLSLDWKLFLGSSLESPSQRDLPEVDLVRFNQSFFCFSLLEWASLITLSFMVHIHKTENKNTRDCFKD